MSFEHTSVLLYECLGELQIRSNGIYVDGTLGGAGHSYEIARKLRGDGRLIGIDRDIAAIEAASAKLEPVREKVQIVRDNYGNIPQIIKNLGYTGVDGILLDLGVSSHQLDTPERGFTYMQEASLDMRMDDRQTLTAKDIVNTYSQRDLTRIIRDYGEDHFAANIAKHIVKNREMKPIETTMELNEIIKAAIPAKVRATGGHPSKRTYQAIRIECNRELEVLQESIDALIMSLNVGGRLCIITFHSLEDRIVKSAFRKNENPCTCPPEFPVCVCHQVSRGRVVTRKPILPGEAELEANKRSQSAKLRVFERS